MPARLYRKKPVLVEAMQYRADTCEMLCRWLGLPHHVYPGVACGVGQFPIETPEGRMVANPGDWIVRGVAGEFYPVKDAIFRETYEALSE